jgi:hypothetical protein
MFQISSSEESIHVGNFNSKTNHFIEITKYKNQESAKIIRSNPNLDYEIKKISFLKKKKRISNFLHKLIEIKPITMAITALVLGIVGIILAVNYLTTLAVLFTLGGFILATTAYNSMKQKNITDGYGLAIIGMILGLGSLIATFIFTFFKF